MKSGIRRFSSKIDKYNSLKRTPFPAVSPFKMVIRDKVYEELNITLFEYKTTGNPKGLIFFLGDYGETNKQYGYLFKKAADNGFAIYSFDYRGSGLSQGPRCEIRE